MILKLSWFVTLPLYSLACLFPNTNGANVICLFIFYDAKDYGLTPNKCGCVGNVDYNILSSSHFYHTHAHSQFTDLQVQIPASGNRYLITQNHRLLMSVADLNLPLNRYGKNNLKSTTDTHR